MRKIGIVLNVLGRIESIIQKVMLNNGEISGTRKSQVKMRYTTKYVYHVLKAIQIKFNIRTKFLLSLSRAKKIQKTAFISTLMEIGITPIVKNSEDIFVLVQKLLYFRGIERKR